jgi:phosphoribosylformylglycinamidine cyclo-ligase
MKSPSPLTGIIPSVWISSITAVNDIFTAALPPSFYLDYIAMGKLNPPRVEAIAGGLVKACQEVGCALSRRDGGDARQIYEDNDYDLVGFIIGVVEKVEIKLGDDVKVGDMIIGLPSSGLHTNGYSLVRKIFGIEPKALNTGYLELGKTLGEALLEPHRCYYPPASAAPVLPLKAWLISQGGSFYKKYSPGTARRPAAQIDKDSWTVPPLSQSYSR